MSEEQSDVILQPSLVQTQDLGKETVINYLYMLPETNCNQPPDSRHPLAPIISPRKYKSPAKSCVLVPGLHPIHHVNFYKRFSHRPPKTH